MDIKKILICILYCNIYFSIQNSICVLSELKVVNLRSRIKSKKIYLCYEVHEKNHPEEHNQYKKIEEIFLSLEKDFANKANYYGKNDNIANIKNYNLEIPVLVEVPIRFDNKDSEEDNKDNLEITRDICPRFKNSSVIKPENINLRLASTSINCLLKQENDPNDIPEDYIFRSSNQVFHAKDLKLIDLFTEIKSFKDTAETIALTFHDSEFGSKINEQFNDLLNRSKEAEKKLLNDLKDYLQELNWDINENINVLELSKKLYELDTNKKNNINDRRKTLIIDIIFTINPLLELNILRRIIENKDSEKIILIIGALHAESIYNALLELGGQVVEKYGQESNFSNDYYVLTKNDLDCIKVPKQSDCTLI